MTEKLTQGPRVNYDASRVGAGLARGPGLDKTLVAAAWSGSWPAPGATLDLDFANNRGWVRGVGQGGAMDAVTFTRASNATFVGSDGKLAGSGSDKGALGLNLLSSPQSFENAAWTKLNVNTATNSGSAPDGTNTAFAMVENATNGEHYCRFASLTYSTLTQYTFSVYVKLLAGTRYFSVQVGNAQLVNVGVIFDSNFNYVSTNGGVYGTVNSYSVVDAGNGWKRCIVTATTTSFSMQGNGPTVSLYQSSSTNIYAGDNTSGYLIWGAQLELGSTATTYYPTNINAPRFDWASTAVVAQRNLLTYTEQFDNAAWTKSNVTVTANATTAPDGTNTADAVVPTATSVNGTLVAQAETIATAISQYTASYRVKPNGFNWVCASIRTLAGTRYIRQWFNLSTAAVGSRTTSGFSFVSASISSPDSYGFYTVTLTVTPDFLDGGVSTFLALADSDASLTATLSGGNGVYLWGAQLEVGASATAYQAITQPTTTTPLVAASTCNGLLVEESRTNRLLWCRDASQTQWVKTNVTAAKDQTGIDGVANAASSLTATGANGTCIQTITLASGSRTSSVYLKRITGTGNVQVSLDGSTWSTVDLSTTEWRRIVLSGTVTNPVVGIKLAVPGDAVAMDYGQVEDGTSETSPILTTTATATRSADIATISEVLFDRIANRAEMSFKATFNCRGGSGQRHVFNYNSAIDTGLLLWNANAGARWYWGVQTGSPVLFFDSPFGTETTVAGSYKRANASFAKAGVTQVSNREISFGFGANLKLSIGCSGGSTYQLNGTIKQLVINTFDLNETQVAELSK